MKKGKNKIEKNFRGKRLLNGVNFFKPFTFLIVFSFSFFVSFLPVSGSGDDPVHEIPVLVLKFFPLDETGKLNRSVIGTDLPDADRNLSAIRAKISRLNSEGIAFMENASRYKGYKNSSVVSSIGPVILDEIEYLEPIPVALSSDGNTPPTNKTAYLNRANVCDYVDNRGVREVWVWMYHSDVVYPVESNMAMGRNIEDLWNYNGYGDVSNSHQLNDLPICDNTYTVYEFNYGRGLGEMIEDFAHQIERLLSYADDTLFSKFVGWTGSYINDSGCGSVNYTPNSRREYGWYNRTEVLSSCEDWKPDGSGTKKLVSCETWGGSGCPDDGGAAWKKWWMQNIPGRDNGLSYNGAGLRNWWDFLGDFDEALSLNRSLTLSDSSVVDICDRTPEVRDAILYTLSVVNCSSVKLGKLGSVFVLDLSSRGIDSLKGGDFDGLTNLQYLRLYNNDLVSLPPGVFDNLTNLDRLYLSGNGLVSLSPGVFDSLTNLRYLSLYENGLVSLSPGVFDSLTNLEELYLSGNGLVSLSPGVFDKLISLDRLSLSGNGLVSLSPGVFDNLTNLDRLDLYDNGLVSLSPGVFDNLTNLDRLDLSGNGLVSLSPGVFDNLTNLDRLDLSGNGLVSLSPGVFDNLTGLGYLDLSGNGLVSLSPGVFDNLTGLGYLDFSANGLVSLSPGVFDNLTDLTNLNFSGNGLVSLYPGVFDNLTGLRYLDFSANGLVSLPPGVFDNLTYLRELGLSGNGLVSLSPGVFDSLIRLKELGLSGNGLVSLSPGVFDSLTFLDELGLSGNGLVSLSPGVFDSLTFLDELDLSGNGLVSLSPGVFDNLTDLRYLDLSGNGLVSLPVGVFDYLTDLYFLDLSDNNLSSLESGVFDGLTNLEGLYLGVGGLVSLSPGVFDNLTYLEKLGLSGNGLVSLPEGVFDGLDDLDTLYLSGNGLVSLPEGVFDDLTNLESLSLGVDGLVSLPEDVFDYLTGLEGLFIVSDGLVSLPEDVFDPLVNLLGLGIVSSNLVSLPPDVSDGKPNLDPDRLYLYNNSLISFESFVAIGLIPPVDNTGPNVSLVAPVEGNFNGSVIFSASSSDDLSGVDRLEFGYRLGSGSVSWFAGRKVGESVWNGSLDTNRLRDGSYNLSVRAFDFAGNNVSLLDVVDIIVDNSEPPPKKDTGTDDSGGGSGGGSGGNDAGEDDEPEVRRVPVSGVVSQSRLLSRVSAGSTVSLSFLRSGLAVSSVSFGVSEELRNVLVSVSSQSNRPSDVSRFDGDVYRYVSVNMSSIGGSSVSNLTVGFKVDGSFVSDNDAVGDEIVLVRYDGHRWVEVDTRMVSYVTGVYSYRAVSDGFGFYVIALKSGPVKEEDVSASSQVTVKSVVEKPSDADSVGDSDEDPEVVSDEEPGFAGGAILYAMIAVILVLIVLGVAAFFVYRRSGWGSHEVVEDPDDKGAGF